MDIPRRSFGRHPDQVSILGLGGYHLGKTPSVTEAVRIVHMALDAGITFLDNAWDTTRARASGGWDARCANGATPPS